MTSTQTPERLSDERFQALTKATFQVGGQWYPTCYALPGMLLGDLLIEAERARAAESSQAEQLAALRSQLAGSQSALTMAMAELTECRSALSTLQAQHEQAQTQAAAMRSALSRCMVVVRRAPVLAEAREAMGSDAGRALLDRLERAERELDEARRLLLRRVEAGRLSEANTDLAAARAENAKLREALNSIAAGMPGDRAGALARAALAPEAAKGGES